MADFKINEIISHINLLYNHSISFTIEQFGKDYENFNDVRCSRCNTTFALDICLDESSYGSNSLFYKYDELYYEFFQLDDLNSKILNCDELIIKGIIE